MIAPTVIGACLSDPQLCKSGLSIGLKIKLDGEMKTSPEERYILDSGGANDNSRGFSLLLKNGKLHAVVSASNTVWTVSNLAECCALITVLGNTKKLNPSRAKWLIRPALISGFRSVKRRRVYDSPLDRRLIHRRLVPAVAGTHLYSWFDWSKSSKVPCSMTFGFDYQNDLKNHGHLTEYWVPLNCGSLRRVHTSDANASVDADARAIKTSVNVT